MVPTATGTLCFNTWETIVVLLPNADTLYITSLLYDYPVVPNIISYI